MLSKMMVPRWDQLDANNDSVLDKDEIATATKLMFQRRRVAAEDTGGAAKPTAAGG